MEAPLKSFPFDFTEYVNENPFPFLSLPGEVRNLIYALYIVEERPYCSRYDEYNALMKTNLILALNYDREDICHPSSDHPIGLVKPFTYMIEKRNTLPQSEALGSNQQIRQEVKSLALKDKLFVDLVGKTHYQALLNLTQTMGSDLRAAIRKMRVGVSGEVRAKGNQLWVDPHDRDTVLGDLSEQGIGTFDLEINPEGTELLIRTPCALGTAQVDYIRTDVQKVVNNWRIRKLDGNDLFSLAMWFKTQEDEKFPRLRNIGERRD
ncbi:hypothetical protein EJ08DRAFT_656558 [Tothia fuscella]|uniref:Uncharacterized protein n=1 Tax=Tothia fuscella TaxID=1048955 RepID=A0A9P4U401_9PEZI|nr:hypothetical protein EJ08DRAFT_656558 [Tothia fuscella]